MSSYVGTRFTPGGRHNGSSKLIFKELSSLLALLSLDPGAYLSILLAPSILNGMILAALTLYIFPVAFLILATTPVG